MIMFDAQDLLKSTTNFKEVTDIFNKLEQQGLDIGKQYTWGQNDI